MKDRTLCAAILAAAALGTSTASAAILANDTFDYGDQKLVGNGGWTALSGAGNAPVQVVSGEVRLTQGGRSREDVSKSLSDTLGPGGEFFAGFDVRVTGGNDAVYFAHFRDADGKSRNGRVFVAPPVGGGDFTFGISDTDGPPEVTFDTDFTFDQSYRVVVGYDFDTGTSTLTVNGASITSETADPGWDVKTFVLRQFEGDSTEFVDNVVVATTFAEVALPEPGTLGLLAAGGLLMLRRRRRY